MSKVSLSADPPIALSPTRIATVGAIALAALSAALYVGAMQIGASLRLAGATVDPTPIDLRIGRHDLAIPANAVRFAEQRTAQPQNEVDLYLAWPSLTGFSEDAKDVFHDPDAKGLLFLRLGAADAATKETPSPAETTEGPAGLTRSLRPGLPGIASQEAVYRAPSDREPAFEASCLDGKDAVMAADCIREVQIEPGLRLRYRFAHALLPQWDRIDRAVLAYIAEHRRS